MLLRPSPSVCGTLLFAVLSCTGKAPDAARAGGTAAGPVAGSPAGAAEPEAVVIGATLPLTGPDAAVGRKFRDGYTLAFAQLAEKGGLQLGRRKVPAQLKLLDDGSDAAAAARLARQLMEQDHVPAFLSTYGTRMVLEQSAVAEELHVPYVASAASATGVYRRGFKYLFGLQAPTEQMAYAEMRWIDNEQKAGRLPTPLRLAVAWENSAFGKDFRAGVVDFATRTTSRKAAYEVVFDEPVEVGAASFAPVVAKLKAAKAQVFLASTHLDEFLALHKAVRTAGLCFPVISYGSRGWEPKAVEVLGREGVSNLLFATWWSNRIDNPQNRAFIASFESAYHRSPEFAEALGYESARVLFAALEKAGTPSPDAVRAALETINLPTLLPGGSLSFPADSGRQARLLYVVQQNQPDGTQPIVYPRELATITGNVPACGGAAHALAGR